MAQGIEVCDGSLSAKSVVNHHRGYQLLFQLSANDNRRYLEPNQIGQEFGLMVVESDDSFNPAAHQHFEERFQTRTIILNICENWEVTDSIERIFNPLHDLITVGIRYVVYHHTNRLTLSVTKRA